MSRFLEVYSADEPIDLQITTEGFIGDIIKKVKTVLKALLKKARKIISVIYKKITDALDLMFTKLKKWYDKHKSTKEAYELPSRIDDFDVYKACPKVTDIYRMCESINSYSHTIYKFTALATDHKMGLFIQKIDPLSIMSLDSYNITVDENGYFTYPSVEELANMLYKVAGKVELTDSWFDKTIEDWRDYRRKFKSLQQDSERTLDRADKLVQNYDMSISQSFIDTEGITVKQQDTMQYNIAILNSLIAFHFDLGKAVVYIVDKMRNTIIKHTRDMLSN